MDISEIKSIYSYSECEQETFPYVRKYMSKITPHIDQLLESKEGRRRFALVGLYLPYRACNHQGGNIATGDSAPPMNPEHKVRLARFQEVSGYEITNTRQYLRLIGFNLLVFFLPNPSIRLYRFARYGKGPWLYSPI